MQYSRKFSNERINKNLALWTLACRTIRGDPFSFEGHEYLREIYEDKHPEKYIQKSAQCGISEYFINESFFLANEFRHNSLIIFPADPQLNDFSHGRVKPAIDGSDYLSDIVTGVDNVGLKRIGQSYIYYRGGQKARKLKSIDADVIYLDEVDEIPPASIELADKRLGHSLLKWKRGASTPTYPEMGINAFMLESDQRRWFLKCEHCNEQQHLSFTENVNMETAQVICKKCKKPIDRLAQGEWVPEKPGLNVRGYYINKLMCVRTDMPKLVKNSLKTSTEAVHEFYNSDLGETHVPEGGQLTDDIMDACRDDYTMPDSAKNCTMGIDVGSLLHVRISEHVSDTEKRAVYIGTVKDFEDIESLMKQYDVSCAVIDALPETRKSKEFCESFPGRALMCYYAGNDYNSKDYEEGKYYTIKTNEDGCPVVLAHRTMACDYMADRLNTRTNRLPKDAKHITDYYKQLKVPIRAIEKTAKGIPYATYLSGSKADHYFHAEVYDEIASRIAIGIRIDPDDIVTSGDDRTFKPEGSKTSGTDRETADMDF